MERPASVQLFIEIDCSFYEGEQIPCLDVYSNDLLLGGFSSGSEDVIRCLVQAIVDRRRRLAAIASKELSCEVLAGIDLSPDKVLYSSAAHVYGLLKKKNITVPQSLHVSSMWQTIYHVLAKSLLWRGIHPSTSPAKWAEICYNAGFHDFVGSSKPKCYNLVATCCVHLSASDPRIAFDLLWWFRDKGLRLEYSQTHSECYSYFPLALYVARLILQVWWRERSFKWSKNLFSTSRLLLTEFVDEKIPDGCDCACSQNGCCAITTILKRPVLNPVTLEVYRPSFESFLPWLVKLLDIADDGWNFLTSSIIRFQTFERLEITHTCCVWIPFSNFKAFDDSNRIEIQEEESVDINTLATLMSEFEEAYNDLGIPFLEFISGYWTTRMNEIMNTDEPIDDDEARRIRELRVVLDPHQERDSQTASPPVSISPPDVKKVFNTTVRKRRHSF